ncbi:MAG: hypothetical protein LKF37_04505 [Lentilactobacillus diolivorans]|jgi:hypothetical protein|uniref:hypothetical protein n=1 Tax=Lentilactobacillus diolivorans TaxID=179838 RepID=UPI000FF532FC|nr:hypothetical protein [Lentilactobacillus diolivorans]MCH4164028.1 hypothetical protein [Lentilactobacillus diolivorans]MDH5105581.1 hypothetical protein [Lentilactobacillus diolivorans]RRG03913.1 MAG: hypothetical protein DUD34_03225 [Lactobacillus sp.]
MIFDWRYSLFQNVPILLAAGLFFIEIRSSINIIGVNYLDLAGVFLGIWLLYYLTVQKRFYGNHSAYKPTNRQLTGLGLIITITGIMICAVLFFEIPAKNDWTAWLAVALSVILKDCCTLPKLTTIQHKSF